MVLEELKEKIDNLPDEDAIELIHDYLSLWYPEMLKD